MVSKFHILRMRNHAKTENPDGTTCHPIVNQLAVLMAAACQATELGADIVQASKLVASLVELELGQDQPEPQPVKVADKPVATSHGADALGMDSIEQIEWETTERPVKKEVVQQLRDLNRPFVLRNLVTQDLHVATFDNRSNELVLRVGYKSTRKAGETRIPVAGGAYRWAFVGVVREVASS